MRKTTGILLLLTMLAVTFVGMGCREHYPHAFAIAGGKIERSHGKPMEGGYYSDWDPFAGSIEISPV